MAEEIDALFNSPDIKKGGKFLICIQLENR